MNEISKKRLSTCHKDLQDLVNSISKKLPIEVICGHRDEQEQNMCFLSGLSKCRWPDSRHNKYPSEAVDIYMKPLDWNDIKGFYEISKEMFLEAKKTGISVKWGGDFVSLKDFPHWELL